MRLGSPGDLGWAEWMRLGGWWCVVAWVSTSVLLPQIVSACGTSRARHGNEPGSLLIFALAFYAIPFVCTANCTCIRAESHSSTSFCEDGRTALLVNRPPCVREDVHMYA